MINVSKLISETMEKLSSKDQYLTVNPSLIPDFDINSVNEAYAFVGSIKNDKKYCNSKYNKDFQYCLIHFLDEKRKEPSFSSNHCIKLFIEQEINSNHLKIEEYSDVYSSPLSGEGLKKRASEALKPVIDYGHFLLSNLERIKIIIASLPQIEKVEPKPAKKDKLTLEDLFCDIKDIERCFQVLRELDKPVITADNKYIGKNKGMFPLWIKVLQNQKPKSLVKKLTDIEISKILNDSIEGLCLSKDASEFRKSYARLEKNGIETQLKTLLASKKML